MILKDGREYKVKSSKILLRLTVAGAESSFYKNRINQNNDNFYYNVVSFAFTEMTKFCNKKISGRVVYRNTVIRINDERMGYPCNWNFQHWMLKQI
jgi:hypothetical protein